MQKGHRGAASEAPICFKPLIKEATYNEKLPGLSRKQCDAIKRDKVNSTDEVFQILCVPVLLFSICRLLVRLA